MQKMNKLIFAALLLACTAAQAQHDTIRGIIIDTGALQREAYRVPTTTVKNDTIPALFLCVDTVPVWQAVTDSIFFYSADGAKVGTKARGMRLKATSELRAAIVTGYWIRRRSYDSIFREGVPITVTTPGALYYLREDPLPSLPNPANCLGADKKPLGKIVFAVYIIK